MTKRILYLLMLFMSFSYVHCEEFKIELKNFTGNNIAPIGAPKPRLVIWESNLPKSATFDLALSMDGGVTFTNQFTATTSTNCIFTPPNLKTSMAMLRIRSLFQGNVVEVKSDEYVIDVWDCSGCRVKVVKWEK